MISLELHRVPLSLCLGVGHTDIAHRVHHIKRGTSELKEPPIVSCYRTFEFSFVPVVPCTYFMLTFKKSKALCQLALQGSICPYLPTSFYRKLVHMFYSRHTLSCTNVPGKWTFEQLTVV